MALLDSAYKQRMVGALVLVALAVIFLPMLFSRQDEQRQLDEDCPPFAGVLCPLPVTFGHAKTGPFNVAGFFSPPIPVPIAVV